MTLICIHRCWGRRCRSSIESVLTNHLHSSSEISLKGPPWKLHPNMLTTSVHSLLITVILLLQCWRWQKSRPLRKTLKPVSHSSWVMSSVVSELKNLKILSWYINAYRWVHTFSMSSKVSKQFYVINLSMMMSSVMSKDECKNSLNIFLKRSNFIKVFLWLNVFVWLFFVSIKSIKNTFLSILSRVPFLWCRSSNLSISCKKRKNS